MVCDGQGRLVSRADPGDVPPSDDEICTDEVCVGEKPEHRPVPTGIGCAYGKVCSAAGACVTCVTSDRRCGDGAIMSCNARAEWVQESVCTGSCWRAVCAPFVEVALGDGHACARFADGSVACWGDNSSGQLGHSHDPPLGPDPALPARVPTLDDVKDLAVGNEHACALRGDGSVVCWGSNDFGQLGDGTRVDRKTPVAPVGITGKVKQIAAGDFHTCALLDDGGVRCWGENDDGQLGDGSVDRPFEGSALGMVGAYAGEGGHRVHGLDAVTMIRSRAHLTCALERRGSVACWGSSIGHGKLMVQASKMGKHRSVKVRRIGDATALALGAAHSCALLRDKTALCWGDNSLGQLGDGTTRSRVSPAPVKGLAGIEALSAGSHVTCARLGDGTVHCWGTNGTAQLGDGSTEDRRGPIAVADLRDSRDLVVASTSACATLTSGSIVCWGGTRMGETGPTPRRRPAALSIGGILP